MTSSNPAMGPRRWLRKAWRRNPAHPKRSPNAFVATSRSGGRSQPKPAAGPGKTLLGREKKPGKRAVGHGEKDRERGRGHQLRPVVVLLEGRTNPYEGTLDMCLQ